MKSMPTSVIYHLLFPGPEDTLNWQAPSCFDYSFYRASDGLDQYATSSMMASKAFKLRPFTVRECSWVRLFALSWPVWKVRVLSTACIAQIEEFYSSWNLERVLFLFHPCKNTQVHIFRTKIFTPSMSHTLRLPLKNDDLDLHTLKIKPSNNS